jgi:hypothetical protein
LQGVLDNQFALEFLTRIDSLIDKGCKEFIFDFSKADILESPAVASILTVTEKIVDDCQGHLVLCGLGTMHRKVLEMVGVFLYASCCETVADATGENRA